MERRPSTDHRSLNGPSYLSVEGNKDNNINFVKFGTTEAMTARRDDDGPSRGLSTQTRLVRFSLIRTLLLLGFFIMNSSKKTSFWGSNLLIVDFFNS